MTFRALVASFCLYEKRESLGCLMLADEASLTWIALVAAEVGPGLAAVACTLRVSRRYRAGWAHFSFCFIAFLRFKCANRAVIVHWAVYDADICAFGLAVLACLAQQGVATAHWAPGTSLTCYRFAGSDFAVEVLWTDLALVHL